MNFTSKCCACSIHDSPLGVIICGVPRLLLGHLFSFEEFERGKHDLLFLLHGRQLLLVVLGGSSHRGASCSHRRLSGDLMLMLLLMLRLCLLLESGRLLSRLMRCRLVNRGSCQSGAGR